MMKKITALFIAIIMLAALVPTMISAKSYEYMSDYEGNQAAHWDNIVTYKPGEGDTEVQEYIGTNGQVVNYIRDHNSVVEKGDETGFALRGWVAFDQEIKAFGYQLDSGEAVYNESYYKTAESGVVNAGINAGCDYAARFSIEFNAADFTKTTIIRGIVKLGDGSEYVISATAADVEFTYKVESEEQTPEPTETTPPTLEE